MAQTRPDDTEAERPSYLRLRGTAIASRGHVLVVDDDAAALRALDSLLREQGFTTSTAAGGEEALVEARRALPDVVLTDLRMGPMDGVELLNRLHEFAPELAVIVMTAYSDASSVIDSLRGRADDYLIKPLQHDTVVWRVDRAIERRRARLEQERIQRTLNERLLMSSVLEQEHAEASARHAAQLEALLQNLREGVIIADPHSRDLVVNEAGRKILGLPEGLSLREHADWLQVHDLEDRPLGDAQRPCMRALRGEEFVDEELLRVRPNGERRRVVSTGTCVRDENGDVALAVVVFRDVTELRRLEQQREEYLALISHDLRNPLHALTMSLGRLKASLAPTQRTAVPLPERMKLLERTERNAQRMVVMLEELREATSLEMEGVVLERVPCDVRKVVANVVDSFDDVQSRRISIEIDPTSPHVVLADGAKLERAVANLVANALKYSFGGPVKVRLGGADPSVEIDVVDRGIGIAAESVNRLFERSYRTSAGKMHTEGLGLGLYIAGSIVQLHDGRIDVSSEVGKGSTFRVTLPAYGASPHG